MTKILTLSEIQQGLKDKRLQVVAERIGLSYPTLKKLSDGIDDNYKLETLKAVSEYLSNSND